MLKHIKSFTVTTVLISFTIVCPLSNAQVNIKTKPIATKIDADLAIAFVETPRLRTRTAHEVVKMIYYAPDTGNISDEIVVADIPVGFSVKKLDMVINNQNDADIVYQLGSSGVPDGPMYHVFIKRSNLLSISAPRVIQIPNSANNDIVDFSLEVDEVTGEALLAATQYDIIGSLLSVYFGKKANGQTSFNLTRPYFTPGGGAGKTVDIAKSTVTGFISIIFNPGDLWGVIAPFSYEEVILNSQGNFIQVKNINGNTPAYALAHGGEFGKNYNIKPGVFAYGSGIRSLFNAPGIYVDTYQFRNNPYQGWAQTPALVSPLGTASDLMFLEPSVALLPVLEGGNFFPLGRTNDKLMVYLTVDLVTWVPHLIASKTGAGADSHFENVVIPKKLNPNSAMNQYPVSIVTTREEGPFGSVWPRRDGLIKIEAHSGNFSFINWKTETLVTKSRSSTQSIGFICAEWLKR